MHLLSDPSEVSKWRDEIGELIERTVELPDMVFRHHCACFSFFNFYEILRNGSLDRLLGFAWLTGASKCYLSALKPDPEKYFISSAGAVGVLSIDSSDSTLGVLAMLQSERDGSPADSIAIRADVLTLHAPHLQWAIYADRERELCIGGFGNEHLHGEFEKACSELTFDRDVAVALAAREESPEWRRSFMKNYLDQ